VTTIRPEVVELVTERTVAVRLELPMAAFDLGAAFGQWLPRVAAAIPESGAVIAGPAFGRYHRFGPDVVDVEIGFPVTGLSSLPWLAALGTSEIGRSELPAGPAAVVTHRGPYDGLPAVYDALHEWIHAQPGLDDGIGPWESYVDEPGSVPLEDTRTKVVWPLVPDEGLR